MTEPCREDVLYVEPLRAYPDKEYVAPVALPLNTMAAHLRRRQEELERENKWLTRIPAS